MFIIWIRLYNLLFGDISLIIWNFLLRSSYTNARAQLQFKVIQIKCQNNHLS